MMTDINRLLPSIGTQCFRNYYETAIVTTQVACRAL